MHTTRYWVRGADQREYGPVEAPVVKRWIEEGRLTSASLVRREDATEWLALAAMPEWTGVTTPPPLLVAPAVRAAQQGPQVSGLAVASLVAGLLTLCTVGISGMVGMVLGVLALVRMHGQPGRWRGQGLAIAGVMVSAVLTALVAALLLGVALPNFLKARETAQRNACLNHLRQIDAAKEMWVRENKKRNTDAPTWEDLVGPGKYFQKQPTCPAGGTYTIGDMMTEPTCSIPTHSLQYPVRRRDPR